MVFSVLTWIVCLGLTATLIGSFECPAYEPKYHYPLVRNKQFDFPTYSSVALLSSAATPVCLPPLRINVRKKGIVRVQNKNARVIFNPDRSDVVTLTGGPVFNDKYIFAESRYASEGVPNNTRPANTHDGVGYPAQFMMVFYKSSYKSFGNALKYRDGIVKILFPLIVVGNVDNSLFTPVQKVLYDVRMDKATSFIYAKEAFHWLLEIFDNCEPYYVHPGAYLMITGEQFFCTNDIHPNFNTITWISHRQFNVFGKILNKFNQLRTDTSAVHPLGSRPFVEATESPVHVQYH